jgi:hypothetical protein
MGDCADPWHVHIIGRCKWSALSLDPLVLLNAHLALFSLRLVALYRSNRFMVWFIRVFFFASYVATLGLVIDSTITYYSEF